MNKPSHKNLPQGKQRKKECGLCGGTGQLTYFQGVSRFLLSWEECSECGGLGFVIDEKSDKIS